MLHDIRAHNLPKEVTLIPVNRRPAVIFQHAPVVWRAQEIRQKHLLGAGVGWDASVLVAGEAVMCHGDVREWAQ